MPQTKPVLMRPEYNIARFCAKLMTSHPSSKGTEQRTKVLLRPNLSIAHPPMGHPKMAPTATKDCKKGKKKGFVWVWFFTETAVECPKRVRVRKKKIHFYTITDALQSCVVFSQVQFVRGIKTFFLIF